MFIYICDEFSRERTFSKPPPGSPPGPYDNCVEGTSEFKSNINLFYFKQRAEIIFARFSNFAIEGTVDPSHAGMISASFFVVIALILVMCFKKRFRKTFPNVGWIQVAVLSLWNFSYLWSALYSSPSMLKQNNL